MKHHTTQPEYLFKKQLHIAHCVVRAINVKQLCSAALCIERAVIFKHLCSVAHFS